jgi:phosphoribosyl 1,2-cyclic phosphodiesterase
VRFASLGSGSEGNALLIECRDDATTVRVLIDCGFGIREARRRLGLLGLEPADLAAILVTHEHGDHVGGAFRLARDARVPVYATRGTLRAVQPGAIFQDGAYRSDALEVIAIDPGRIFEIAGVRIEPVAVPHDAREPVQFIVDDGRARFAAITDLGHASNHVVQAMARIDALLLECNHDPEMLAHSEYPLSLRRRIAGPYGHLSNEAAAGLLAAIDQSRLRSVSAAHLSRQNNRPEFAREALAGAWGVTPEQIRVADQDEGLGWLGV